MIFDRHLVAAAIVVSAIAAGPALAATSPQAAADALLATDRAFAAASAKTDLISGLSAQFDEAVIMPLPGGKFAHGKAEAIAALKTNPDNPTSRTEWTPIRVGVSADGQHGFSFGFLTTRRQGKPDLAGKYLAYWVKRPGGWRVLAYKRAPRPEGEVSLAVMEPSLPAVIVPVTNDAATIAAHRKSLADAEKAFSDEARVIGLGPAFAKFGRSDGMNMGGGPGFTMGNEQIGAQSGEEGKKPTSVYWSSDDVAVASSGDLGVSWGVIRGHRPEQGYPPEGSPFFTIWRRDGPSDPWRHIAE